jgi:hypothetical protein
MRRNLDEVLASQAKMMKRRGEPQAVPDEQMKRFFENHLRRVESSLEKRADTSVLYLDHGELIADPRGQATSIANFLNLPLDVQRMAAAVDRRLYRNRRS